MGMFSSSKETVVGTAAMHLMDVDNLGNPIGDTILEAVLTSGVPVASMQDIPGRIIQSNLNGFSLKIERAYEYARDHYKLGLPAGANMQLPTVTSVQIKPYILTETGYPHDIFITDHEYTPYTPMISIAAFLRNTRDYDSITDTVNNWPAGVVFTQHWNEDISSFEKRVSILSVDVLSDNITARITYQKHILRPTTVKEEVEYDGGDAGTYYRTEYNISNIWNLDGTLTEDITIPGASAATPWNTDCLFVLYKELDSGGAVLPTTIAWIYFLEDGLYPELHPDINQSTDTFLPVIPIRYNNQDLTRPNETELFTTSKKLMKLLGNNLTKQGDQLNANPSIADIDNAYIMFGINIQTDFIPSLYYLNHHFHQLYVNQYGDETSFLAALADPAINDEPYNTQVFNTIARWANRSAPETAFKEYGLALDVQYDYIKTSTVLGTIGEEGHATKSIGSYEVTSSHTTGGGDSPEYTYTTTSTRYKLILKAQINPFEVRTVEVYNLSVTNWVYGRHHVITTLDMVRNSSDENGLIIPVQYQLSKQVFDIFNMETRNAFYSDTIMIVINAIDRIKVKWYEKSFFKFIVIIVAIIVIYYTGQAWIGKFVAAYVAGGVVGALVFLAGTALASLALSYAVNYIVRNYGEKIGIIGAVILTIVAIIASRGAFGAGAFGQFMMSSAPMMLQTATALISTTNEFLVEKGAEIVNDFEIFTEKMGGLWEELEEIQDLLAMKADLDPLVFTKPERLKILPNENPTVFFNRCLGLVDNTMFTTHDEIPNFFDMRLRHTKDITPTMYGLNSYS